jgi:hypothetical protein
MANLADASSTELSAPPQQLQAPTSSVHEAQSKLKQDESNAVEHKISEHNDPSQNGASQQADVADDVSEKLMLLHLYHQLLCTQR